MKAMLSLIALITIQTSLDADAQFDFWVGEWECAGKSRAAPGTDEWTNTKATNSIKKILGGEVVEENFSMPGFDGKSVTVYDAANKIWRQTWVDSSGGYLSFTGGVEEGDMTLNLTPTAATPKGVRMRMVFKEVKKEAFVWNWERSADEGKTWELQWRLDYKRKS